MKKKYSFKLAKPSRKSSKKLSKAINKDVKWYQVKRNCEFFVINPIVKPQSLEYQQETPQSSGKNVAAQPNSETREAPKGLKNLKAKRKASSKKILLNQTQAK